MYIYIYTYIHIHIQIQIQIHIQICLGFGDHAARSAMLLCNVTYISYGSQASFLRGEDDEETALQKEAKKREREDAKEVRRNDPKVQAEKWLNGLSSYIWLTGHRTGQATWLVARLLA